MNDDVLTAFDALLEAMNSEKVQLADAVKEAILNRQGAEAQRLLAKTERIEQLIGQAQRLREAWERLGGPRRRRRGPRGAVDITPNQAYRVPVLEALEQLGGRGRTQEVLNIVYEKMKDCLTEDDLKPLPEGGDVRWRNMAAWARYRMVNEGFLRDDSPRGIWEMTEAGRAYLEQARRQIREGNEP